MARFDLLGCFEVAFLKGQVLSSYSEVFTGAKGHDSLSWFVKFIVDMLFEFLGSPVDQAIWISDDS